MTVEARFNLQRGGFHLEAELTAPATGITALFGPSGCGKTTMLRAMAGLEKCPGGYVRVDGEVWQDGPVFVPVHRRGLGYVFQESSLFAHLTVRQNLEYGYQRTSTGRRKTDPNEAAAMLGITHLLTRKPEGLSGGERQRVALARALVTAPVLLLMDEPLASLDAAGKAEILPYLKDVPTRLGIPALFVSHDLTEVSRLADHLALMEDGRILAAGPLNEMLTRTDLSLARMPEAAAVVTVITRAHDPRYDLTELDFSGGVLTVPRLDLDPGQPARLRIMARDVSLTLRRQTETSILNVLPAQVSSLVDQGPSQVTVVLQVGKETILARITRKSCENLGITEGKEVFAQVKSLAVLT